MRRTFLFVGSFCLSLAVLLMTACEKDDDKKNESEEKTLDELVYSMPEPLQEPTYNEQIGDVVTEIDETTDTYCECTKYKASEAFSDVMLLDPTTSVIYPGSVLDGNSVTDGSYRQIVLPRAPLGISTNLPNFDGDCRRTVENPSLSSVRSAMKEMIYDANINGDTPAKTTFEIEEIYSAEQLELAIGANVKSSGVKVSAGFDFNKKEIRSRFLVKFIQVYYSVDVDAPSSPSGFFDPSVTADDFRNAVGGNAAMPVYVASVQYGRVAYFCMESEERSDSVGATLKATMKTGVTKVQLDAAFSNNKYTKNMKISGTVSGGSGSDAMQAVTGKEGMMKYILEGGNFSKTSPGAPVAFTLAKLSNNEIFSVINGTEYVARQCKSTNASIIPQYFYGEEGDNDVYGRIYVQLYYEGENVLSDPVYLFNKSKKEAVSVGVGKRVDLDFPEDNMFKIDYNRIDKAKIILFGQLYDDDTNTPHCGCKEDDIDETYDPFVMEYRLSDWKKLYRNQLDVEDNIVIPGISYDQEWHWDHYSSGFFGKDTSHDREKVKGNGRIKFAFKFNM